MKWQKSPPQLIAAFDSVVPGPPAVRRSMFGYPAAFVNGNMFMGLHQSNMVLRLEDHTRQEFLKLAGAHTFEPMPGRPMREYVVVPPTLITDSKKLTPWVSKALEYGTTLKPKEKGAKAKSAAKAKSQATKKKKK